MDIDATFKSIRTVYQTISGKQESDVILTYKGTSHGLTTPWHVRVGERECLNETHEGALHQILDMLKTELATKTKSAEQEAVRLRQALNQLGN